MGKPPHTLEEERRLPLLLRKEERQDEGSLVAFSRSGRWPEPDRSGFPSRKSRLYYTPLQLPPSLWPSGRPTDVQHHTFFYNVKRRAVAEFPFGPGKGRECPSVRRTMDGRYQSRREGGEEQPSNFQDPPFKKRGIDGREGGEQTLHVS